MDTVPGKDVCSEARRRITTASPPATKITPSIAAAPIAKSPHTNPFGDSDGGWGAGNDARYAETVPHVHRLATKLLRPAETVPHVHRLATKHLRPVLSLRHADRARVGGLHRPGDEREGGNRGQQSRDPVNVLPRPCISSSLSWPPCAAFAQETTCG